MGHARMGHLSEFFVRRLYAAGKLSIADGVAALVRAGLKLHASEGDYDDPETLGMALGDLVHYLTRRDPSAEGYTGPAGGGPWLVPVFRAAAFAPKGLDRHTRALFSRCERDRIGDGARYAVLGDVLEDAGHQDAARRVRELPALRAAWLAWAAGPGLDDWDGEDSVGQRFERVPRAFAPGWRKRYREIPLLDRMEN